jgi:hypothetical protein
MTKLKFHPAEHRDSSDPIPFPRQGGWSGTLGSVNAEPRWAQGAPVYRFAGRPIDAVSMAESAVDRAQRQMERLKELLGAEIGDDRPSAA